METNLNSSFAEAQASSLPPATGSSRLNVGTGERIASVIGGTALAIFAARKFNTVTGKLLGLAGLMLLKRGATGYCEVNNAFGRNTAHSKSKAMEVRVTYSINKSKEEVYAFWRNFENLPSFMKHLEHVSVQDSMKSEWTAKLPGGVGTVSWQAIITDEEENRLIAWSSLPGSTIDNAGEVSFTDSPLGGTEIHARISYRLPAGDAGSVAGKLFNPLVEKMIKEDLRRFKSLMETGEIPTKKDSSSKISKALDSLVD
jgi:uncharacterized membrane protein